MRSGLRSEKRYGLAAWLLGIALILSGLTDSVAQSRKGLSNVENLLVDSTAHRVYYEQRLYRNPFLGLLDVAQPMAAKGIRTFVPLYQGVPIAQYRLDTTVTTTTLSRPERQRFAKQHPFDSRAYKFDFRL